MDVPFRIFEPFADRLHVAIFGKQDSAQRVPENGIASLQQVHGNRSVVIRAPQDRIQQADGMATDVAGLTLTVRWADCQNFIIFAPQANVIGVVHAGWRGLLAGVLQKHFAMLKNEWGIRPAETWVGAGPSLCTACAAFTNPRTELPGMDARFFHGRHVDLYGIADAQLAAIGVPVQHRERMEGCPCCQTHRYWSYRGGDQDAILQGATNILLCSLLPA